MDRITGSARSHDGAVAVEVLPGGALSSITLTPAATGLGARGLADAVLAAVAEATALANQRTRAALRAGLAGVGDRELSALGLDTPDELVERVEATTPERWNVQ